MKIDEINDRIEELKEAKRCFLLAQKEFGNETRNYIGGWHCELAVELIEKEIEQLTNHDWK
jgi:Tfp pilus assembly ATPase PilU